MCPLNNRFPLRFPQEFLNGLHVALFEPEIPLNVGSIARTCAVTNTPLHLVGRVGFHLDNRLAKRAGLDYWEHADVHIHIKWSDFSAEFPDRRMLLFSTKGKTALWDVDIKPDDVMVFGSERTGLPDEILNSDCGEIVTIPMVEGFRSLNLANTVSIALYEGIRQQLANR